MFLIPFVALLIGVLVGIQFGFPFSGFVGTYIGISVIAGIDSVFGGWRAALEGKFQNDVFLTGFFSNVLIAAFLSYLGDKVGIDLFMAAALVMGWRIFTNLSMIRRYAIVRWQDSRSKSRIDQG